MSQSEIREGLTFDDVLLVPAASEVLPNEVDLRTRFTTDIELHTPLVAAAMDTVTEHETAICMARNGGIGIVHKNLSIADQAAEVDKVKRSESGMIVDPITMRPEQPIREALEVMSRFRISGVPVTRDGKAVGILTNRDLRFVKDVTAEISTVMTNRRPRDGAARHRRWSGPRSCSTEHRIEKLLVVDDNGRLLCGSSRSRTSRRPSAIPTPARTTWVACAAAPRSASATDRLERAQALVDRWRRRDRRGYGARPFGRGAANDPRTEAVISPTSPWSAATSRRPRARRR